VSVFPYEIYIINNREGVVIERYFINHEILKFERNFLPWTPGIKVPTQDITLTDRNKLKKHLPNDSFVHII